MNKCIDDWDFLGAEGFKKSLIYTKNKLTILKRLGNPHLDKIEALKQRIKYLKRRREKRKFSESLLEIVNRDITNSENELLELINSKIPPFYDKDELLICLEKIETDELQKFYLEVEEGHFIIEILKIENGILIILKAERSPVWMMNHGKSELRKMGFTIAEKEANLKIDNFDKTKMTFVLEILSRLAYDVFGLYRDRNKKANIKFFDF